MNKFKTIFLLLLLGLFACTNDEPISKNINSNSKSNTLNSAIEVAEKMISDLDGASSTRSFTRKIKNIEPVWNTRSNSNQALYVISYEDNKGFALVSTSDKDFSILGFSNHGNMSANDIATNPGLKSYANSAWGSDSISIGGWGPGVRPWKPNTPKSYGVIKVSPLIQQSVAEWGQWYPFNRCCSLVMDKEGVLRRVPTGCVALAMTITMSHYQWPTIYKDINLNWSDILVNQNNYGLAQLLAYLALPENLNSYCTPEFTSSSSTVVPRTFNNLGYNTPTLNKGISTSELDNGYPLIIFGDLLDDNGYVTNEGHAWVIDGVYMFHHDKDLLDSNVDPYDEYFYHTIWGWHGANNGYFRYGSITDKAPGYVQDYETQIDAPYQYTNFWSIGALTKR